jgi:hypothetical protein
MIHRYAPQHHALTLSLLLGLSAIAGCDESEAAEEGTEPPATETAPAEAEAAPEPATPDGWEEVEVQVQGHAVMALAPTTEQEIEATDSLTTIYGTLPGQSYPYYFSLEHHEQAPELRMILNKSGLDREDTGYGYRAEVRDEDGNGWSYVVYNEAQKLSCKVSLSATGGVSDALIEEARRPCDRLAQ